jgi:hypothetical protein
VLNLGIVTKVWALDISTAIHTIERHFNCKTDGPGFEDHQDTKYSYFISTAYTLSIWLILYIWMPKLIATVHVSVKLSSC